MLHVSYKKAPLTIGDDVTIGHSCILHGCTLQNRILVGMGSTIMDNAVIESDVVIGAGTLITENMVVPSGSLVLGRPGKVIRSLSPEEMGYLKKAAEHYIHVAKSYQGGPWPY
jgi:carbonic anhydrase/acetyltransferase-like protein (isoleucine patch superfamily)